MSNLFTKYNRLERDSISDLTSDEETNEFDVKLDGVYRDSEARHSMQQEMTPYMRSSFEALYDFHGKGAVPKKMSKVEIPFSDGGGASSNDGSDDEEIHKTCLQTIHRSIDNSAIDTGVDHQQRHSRQEHLDQMNIAENQLPGSSELINSEILSETSLDFWLGRKPLTPISTNGTQKYCPLIESESRPDKPSENDNASVDKENASLAAFVHEKNEDLSCSALSASLSDFDGIHASDKQDQSSCKQKDLETMMMQKTHDSRQDGQSQICPSSPGAEERRKCSEFDDIPNAAMSMPQSKSNNNVPFDRRVSPSENLFDLEGRPLELFNIPAEGVLSDGDQLFDSKRYLLGRFHQNRRPNCNIVLVREMNDYDPVYNSSGMFVDVLKNLKAGCHNIEDLPQDKKLFNFNGDLVGGADVGEAKANGKRPRKRATFVEQMFDDDPVFDLDGRFVGSVAQLRNGAGVNDLDMNEELFDSFGDLIGNIAICDRLISAEQVSDKEDDLLDHVGQPIGGIHEILQHGAHRVHFPEKDAYAERPTKRHNVDECHEALEKFVDKFDSLSKTDMGASSAPNQATCNGLKQFSLNNSFREDDKKHSQMSAGVVASQVTLLYPNHAKSTEIGNLFQIPGADQSVYQQESDTIQNVASSNYQKTSLSAADHHGRTTSSNASTDTAPMLPPRSRANNQKSPRNASQSTP